MLLGPLSQPLFKLFLLFNVLISMCTVRVFCPIYLNSNIQAAPIGISRGVKKLIQTKLPNMSQLSDISDYVLR